VGCFFFFSQLFQFVGGIPKDAVENTAPDILPVRVSLVRQPDHIVREFQGLPYIFVTWSHTMFRKNNMSNIFVLGGLPVELPDGIILLQFVYHMQKKASDCL
jgi:hypothetical protein